jgi:hypothetical protein
MILQGELNDFSLADLLQLLLQQRKSGALMLSHGKEKAEINLSQGMIIGVQVGGSTPEQRIRDMLVELRRISRKEMTELEAVSLNMNRSLLATLSAKGYLSDEESDRILAVASEDMVFDLFTWTEGRYEFGTTQKGLPPGLGKMRVSTEFACMEGMRRIDEFPRLNEQIPSEAMVFYRTEKACDSEDPWEQSVYSQMDGKLPLSSLLKRLPFGYFRLLECVVNLWDTGCIAPREGLVAPVEVAQVVDPRAERDQKTAFALGLSAMVLILALVFRLVAAWVMSTKVDANESTTQIRVESEILRKNASAVLVEHLSQTGELPESLGDLVKDGELAAYEIRGPDKGRIHYTKVGRLDFVLR